MLSRALITERLCGSNSATICYFFFKDNEEQNNILNAMCAILHQLFCNDESLLQRYGGPAFEKHGDRLKDDFETLWKLWLNTATDENAGEVICIFDALDECKR